MAPPSDPYILWPTKEIATRYRRPFIGPTTGTSGTISWTITGVEKTTLVYDASLDSRLKALEQAYRDIEESVASLSSHFQEGKVTIIALHRLINFDLSESIDVILEPDGDGFIARTVDLDLFGFGDDPKEAVNNLKLEIEGLYHDLMTDDNFSEEWLKVKSFLQRMIKDK
ncbi:MAG: hypothetical protein AB1641_21005 [Thermodesulfobacteriota bacterium]